MNEVKVGKLSIIASYTCNFISKLLQGGKNMFCVGRPNCECSRFQNTVCSPHQEKEKNIYIANEEMGEATVGSR